MTDRTRLRIFGLLNACGGLALLAVGAYSEDGLLSFRTTFWGCVFVLLAGVGFWLGRVVETRTQEGSDAGEVDDDR